MQDFKSLFVIGAPKAGTTTLAQLLAQHPAIFQGPVKEPKFFTDFAERRWAGPHGDNFTITICREYADYLALFADAPAGAWRLDASTDYLANDTARRRLAAWSEDTPTRLICMLRDPIERAVSEYRHTLRDLIESESLARAIALEPERRQAGWQPLFGHVRRSRYHGDVTAYLDGFGDDLLLLDFAELRDPTRLLAKIERFLGLSPATGETAMPRPEAAPDAPAGAVVENRSHSYRSMALQRALRNPGLLRAARAIVPQQTRRWVRGRLERVNRTRFEPAEGDLRLLYDALADDIDACLSDSRLPTDSWALSRRLAGAAAAPPARPEAR